MAKLLPTAAKIALLEKYMKMGAPMADVFAASQVASSTYYRWMSIGQALCEGDLEHPDNWMPKRIMRAGITRKMHHQHSVMAPDMVE